MLYGVYYLKYVICASSSISYTLTAACCGCIGSSCRVIINPGFWKHSMLCVQEHVNE